MVGLAISETKDIEGIGVRELGWVSISRAMHGKHGVCLPDQLARQHDFSVGYAWIVLGRTSIPHALLQGSSSEVWLFSEPSKLLRMLEQRQQGAAGHERRRLKSCDEHGLAQRNHFSG